MLKLLNFEFYQDVKLKVKVMRSVRNNFGLKAYNTVYNILLKINRLNLLMKFCSKVLKCMVHTFMSVACLTLIILRLGIYYRSFFSLTKNEIFYTKI